VSWPFIVLLALALVLVVGAEWHRVANLAGADGRRARERRRRKANLRLVRTDEEEFEESVQRDLSQLPTIEERDPR
jgi:Tfp pilus assembly protein PilO